MNKFLQEILQQPAAVEEVFSFYNSPSGRNLLIEAKKIISNGKTEQIIFTGMGSSYFISHAASNLFNSCKLNSFIVNTSELLHYNLHLFERETLLVCISQSGESFEIKEILKKFTEKVHCIGIVNDEQSTLAIKADIALPCKAGKEEMTSTKTYVTASLVSFILGWYLSGNWDKMKVKKTEDFAGNFKTVFTPYKTQVEELITFLGNLQTPQIIARGPAFSTASQSALMFREALHIPATGMLGGEFRHGPMEMVSDGFKSVLFAQKGRTFAQSLKMAEDIAGFGGRVLVITNENLNFSSENIIPVFINEQDEYLFSILGIVPVQLFVDSYAKSKGFEAGSFSRGSKVTETE